MTTRFGCTFLTLILLSSALTGCFGFDDELQEEPEYEHWLPDVEDRSNKYYRDNDVFSRVSWNGSFGIDTVRSIFVPVPAITASDGGAGGVDGTAGAGDGTAGAGDVAGNEGTGLEPQGVEGGDPIADDDTPNLDGECERCTREGGLVSIRVVSY